MGVIGEIIAEEFEKYIYEMVAPYEVIENGIKVFWKYKRKWFNRVLEGTAYGVLTGQCTEKTAVVELTSTGPDGRAGNDKMRVAISKLRTVDGNKRLITPTEYQKKMDKASDSNYYND